MVVAGAFTISHTKCLKRGLLKEFRGPFGFFCMECRRGLLIRRRGLLIPVHACLSLQTVRAGTHHPILDV
jgi:hypothetical protein